MSESTITISDRASVSELIAKLSMGFALEQRFLVQAILPDGTAWNAPATIGTVDGSNCGDGLPYLYLQIRCDGEKESDD